MSERVSEIGRENNCERGESEKIFEGAKQICMTEKRGRYFISTSIIL
jgi:hypothetical protein